MSGLISVPFHDIKHYLSINNQSISEITNKNYVTAIDLINSGESINIPESIQDWVIANNLRSDGLIIPTYDASTILISSHTDLEDLAAFLSLEDTNKIRIIRILGFLGYLNNDMSVLEILPVEVLKLITSYLNYSQIILMFKVSKKFLKIRSQFLQTGIDTLLRQKLVTVIKRDVSNYKERQLINLYKVYLHKNNISACGGFSLILSTEGVVYSCGNNKHGQLGLHYKFDDKNKMKFNDTERVKFGRNMSEYNNKIIQISAGKTHSLILTDTNQIYIYGLGKPRQLMTTNITTIVKISSGGFHLLILSNEGHVYAFGYNAHGQLGIGTTSHRKNALNFIDSLYNIIDISAGHSHSLVLTLDNQVYGFGSNEFAQLGLSDYKNRFTPTLINVHNIIGISAGYNHSLLLTLSGQIYVCGDNTYGQLGLSAFCKISIFTVIHKLYNIIRISAGKNFSLATDNDGKLYVFGSNSHGQLGSNLSNLNIPTVVDNHKINNVEHISAGYRHSLIKLKNGDVYGFGSNNYEQLGDAKTKNTNDINRFRLICNINNLSKI